MKLLFLILLITSWCSCSSSGKDGVQKSAELQLENVEAKRLLLGVWINDDSNVPLLFVKGDSLRFIGQSDDPIEFKIYKDSLYTYGYDVMTYKIDRQSEYDFWFHSLSDRIVKLYRSENLEDSLYFKEDSQREPMPIYTEVVQKDSVVFFDNRRFRGYVYINPSSYKINKPTYSDEGIRLDEVFYDNVIHICVYEGSKSLFARDMYKTDFKSFLTDSFYEQSVLVDMSFTGVDAAGFHFTARVGVPESFIHNLIGVTISFNGDMQMELKEGTITSQENIGL